MNCTVLYGQHKKETYGRIYKKLSNELASEFHRSQFCFELNTGIVVEVDVCSYEEARLLIAAEFRAVDTIQFLELRKNSQLKRCHMSSRVLTLTA